MMRPALSLALALALALNVQSAAAQSAPSPAAQLAAEIKAHAAVMPLLEELCDDIGPRLTGSAGLHRAQDWAMRKLAGYGATNVHLEAYDLGRPWHRGRASARLLNASGMPLDVVQKAWTEGTRGPVRGEVAVLDAKTLDQMQAALPSLRGKIVLVLAAPRPGPEEQNDLPRFRAALDRAWLDAQPAALLLVAAKAAGLRDMWGGPTARVHRNEAIITREHAAVLQRLIARGQVPKVELAMDGGFGPAPVQAHNVVADLPGTDPTAGMVILGAHLDSWDLGPGATDNGSGVVAVLEAMRALHAVGLKPQRTVRVVLFSGEEQGLLGSKAYAAAHRAELDDVQAVLVQDAGAGRIMGFPDMKVEAWFVALTSALAPAQSLGPLDVTYAVSKGSDHETFFKLGIPAFAPMQDPRDYPTHTQHTQADTIDHVSAADLVQAAQVMAVLAWQLAHGPRLPHVAHVPSGTTGT
ncbi:M20/M25/M40 family metallo-hydrolase [Massilia arenosa]|uniref:Carboxypeptidase Q n=1 Tax=Zemynaea arenosa TaxID=2561931 RepID=A0A4Y9RTZ4_9BURK|nr:M20/M25/M40 family metallo-hydrolase [Massilia arenosa]TFW10728.1 M20/M25/M40 family metallo-hydrolase [Massilia arenosa]